MSILKSLTSSIASAVVQSVVYTVVADKTRSYLEKRKEEKENAPTSGSKFSSLKKNK